MNRGCSWKAVLAILTGHLIRLGAVGLLILTWLLLSAPIAV